MKLVNARKNCLLLHSDGAIHYPFSRFLSEEFSNSHTRELVAQALRTFYRFCNAHHIELALRAIEGRCLSTVEARKLVGLCYCPLEQLEAMSDRKIVSLTSAKAGKEPWDLPEAVDQNTASKRLNHIAQYINFYREEFLEPNIRSGTLNEQLRVEFDQIKHKLMTAISGTKQGHHHDIKSLPSAKFLAIIRAVFTRPEELFLTKLGKPSRTVRRDRAMALLACECLRPGTLGNITLADFRLEANYLAINDNRAKRSERVSTNTPVLKLGASTRVNSASETMIELWPFTVSAIQDYINTERTTVLSKGLINRSNGFLFLSERGEPIRHRASITQMFNQLGQRLAALGMLDVGDDHYFPNQKQYDFHAYVLRHSHASLFVESKGTDNQAKAQMKPRFGWTLQSKQPERYAARAISDKSNIDLMDFNKSLMSEVLAKKLGTGKLE